jgi:hypothetical protein
VEHPDYGKIEVDEGIADLLEAMWAREIDTLLSCQDNETKRRHWVWIMFPFSGFAEEFLNVVASEYSTDPDSLYQRVMSPDHHIDGWYYRVTPENWETTGTVVDDEWVETSTGTPKLVFEVSVRFPVEDLPAVKKAFGV